MKKKQKPRFIAAKNLETQGAHTFWDVVEVETKKIIFDGFYNKSEAEQLAEALSQNIFRHDPTEWRLVYKGSLDV